MMNNHNKYSTEFINLLFEERMKYTPPRACSYFLFNGETNPIEQKWNVILFKSFIEYFLYLTPYKRGMDCKNYAKQNSQQVME